MNIAGADVLVDASKTHPQATKALSAWRKIVVNEKWTSLADVRKTYPHADGVKLQSGAVITVFNIRGNTYRLLTRINYTAAIVRIIELLTHAEYDKDQWKGRL